MSCDEDWDTPFAGAAPASASCAQTRQSADNDRPQKGFFSKADRDPLKLFVYGLEPNLEESGLRCLLASADCPTPTKVAFRVKTVKEDRGDVQRAFAFVEFASRKEAATAFDLLKKANVRLNYANLSDDRSGVRTKVADIDFDCFRKTFTPIAKENNVSDLINKFETVTVTSGSTPAAQSHSSSPPPFHKVPDEMDQSPSNNKYSISAADTKQMIGHLVQVLESVDSVCKTCASGKEVQHMHYILQEQTLLDPVLDAPPAMQQLSCTLCHTDSKLMKCTGCEHVSYCSRSCQVKDWPRHRRICNATQSPAPSFTASPAVSLNHSARMSPNGTLEQITAPLTNGSARMVIPNGAGDRIKVRSESMRAVDPEQKPIPVPKVADVADGTPVRQTAITRTRIEEPPSSGRPVSSRTDSGSPGKARPGQMMRELLAQPLNDVSPAEPPVKRATPAGPVVQAVVAQKVEKPVRKLVLGQEQSGLIVWQSEEDPDIYFLSGDENTIYKKINKFTLPPPDSVGFLPEVGAYVLARSPDDQEFYRAEVTGVRGDDVAVYFIDYGNTDNVKSSEIRTIPKEIDPMTSAYPPQAVKIMHQDKKAQKKIVHCYNNAEELHFTPIEHKGDYYIVTV